MKKENLPINYNDLLAELKQPKQIVDKLIAIYLKSTGERIEKIKLAFDLKDYELLGIESHTIKGSSLTYKVISLGEISKEIELLCKAGNFEAVDKKIHLMFEEFDRVKKFIKKNILNDL